MNHCNLHIQVSGGHPHTAENIPSINNPFYYSHFSCLLAYPGQHVRVPITDPFKTANKLRDEEVTLFITERRPDNSQGPLPHERRSRTWLAPVKPTALQGEEVCPFFSVMSLWGLSDGVSDGSRLRSWSLGGGDRQKPPFSSPWPFEGSREAGKGRIVSLEMLLL